MFLMNKKIQKRPLFKKCPKYGLVIVLKNSKKTNNNKKHFFKKWNDQPPDQPPSERAGTQVKIVKLHEIREGIKKMRNIRSDWPKGLTYLH